jgi:alpha-D-ribose 1-methylphosphonate 5-triphosphate synthase subunit PhnG
MADMDDLSTPPAQTRRQHWMSVLARAPFAELARLTEGVVFPEVDIIKPAEIGTLMVEGRAGGGGRRFNAGEATLTRCIVREGERLGYAYALGRDKAKALLCARLDALLQDDLRNAEIMAQVVMPLAGMQSAARDLDSRRAASTKVEFFTMVRGDG